jgi:hypothetical protein
VNFASEFDVQKRGFEHTAKKDSLVHTAPACGEGSDHFSSYAHSFSLYFCKRFFLRLESMTS